MSIVSIRGAITIEENTRQAILDGTKEMLEAILEANKIQSENIVQVHFSSTKDLDAVYPAVAAREIGLTNTSLMCFQEMWVVGSLEKCIRVDVLVEQEGLSRKNIKPQYLRGAKKLRPDLVSKEKVNE